MFAALGFAFSFFFPLLRNFCAIPPCGSRAPAPPAAGSAQVGTRSARKRLGYDSAATPARRRDDGVLCVVESPADQLAIEEAGGYQGRYFVLHGHLSPLDGVGPDDIGLDQLEARVADAGVEEVILATNPPVEGEATAHYIASQLAPQGLKLSRLAYGVPMGGELEYVDGGTLSRAFNGRLPFQGE